MKNNIIQRIIGGSYVAGFLILALIGMNLAQASTITTINGTDTLTSSRSVINTNFSNLNTDKVEKTVANIFTALQQFANASSTQFSCYGTCWFGGTATSSFSTVGALTLATPLLPSSGGSGASTLTGILLGNGSSAFTGLTTSSGIFGAISDETGSGFLVGSISPALTGSATAVGLSSTYSTSTTKQNIPNGSAPTVAVTGDVALDTTSDQLIAFGSAAKKVYSNGNQYASFTYATSTAWTATTTIPLGTSRVPETWNDIQCFTDAGTLFVDIYHTTTHPATGINASTTPNTNAFTSNNTTTAGEKRYVDVGTPASSPTKISCTLSKSIIAD